MMIVPLTVAQIDDRVQADLMMIVPLTVAQIDDLSPIEGDRAF